MYTYAVIASAPVQYNQSFLKLLARMTTLVYFYIFLFLISCSYIHVFILNLLHFYIIYSCMINHLIFLLLLIVISVLYVFLVMLDDFGGLMMFV